MAQSQIDSNNNNKPKEAHEPITETQTFTQGFPTFLLPPQRTQQHIAKVKQVGNTTRNTANTSATKITYCLKCRSKQ